jgi:predicted Zn-dependent protease
MSVTSFSPCPKKRKPIVLAVGLLLPIWISLSHAESPTESAPGATEAAPVSATGLGDSIGGFFSNLGNSINQVVAGSRDKQQILDLAPGPYQKSNEAIGEQKDLDESRITRGVLSVPSFTNYANGVLNKLKAVSTVEQVPGQVIVVANDQMDAGSTADGNIYISGGYVRELKNEDQLAALLAHELSHVLLRHHDSNALSRVQKQVASFASAGMGIRNILEKASVSAAGSILSPEQKKILQKMELMISVTDIALSPAWGRRQEAEADRLGMDLMVRAGYSYQEGLIPWLEAVAKWDAEQEQKKAAMFQAQQASMQALIGSGKLDESLKQGLEFAFNDIKGQLSASHEGGDKRLSDMDAYYIKAYEEKVPQVKATNKPFEQARSKPDVKPVLAAYTKVFEARNLVSQQNYAQGQALLKPLLGAKSDISTHALPNQLMFEALRGLGRRKEAEVYLARSLQSDNSVWSVYDSAATYYKDQGNTEAIAKLGQNAFQKFSGAPSAYPLLVALYKRNGLTQNMNSVVAECALKQADKRNQCLDAAK